MGSTFGLFGVTPLLRLSAYARTTRVMIIATPSANSQSIWNGANPPVLDADYVEYEPLSNGGHAVTVSSDGIAVIQTAGDTSRQQFIANHFSRYVLDFTGDAIQYVNNSIPGASTQNLTLVVGTAFSIDFLSAVANTENDALIFEIVSGGLPTGAIFSVSVLSVVPIMSESGSFDLSVSDGLDSSLFTVNWIVNPSSTGTVAGPLVDGTRVKSHTGGALVQ